MYKYGQSRFNQEKEKSQDIIQSNQEEGKTEIIEEGPNNLEFSPNQRIAFKRGAKDSNDPEEEKYETPGRKGEMYSYISLQKMSQKQKDYLSKGYWMFDNPKYWDLSSEELNPLIDFLNKYFGDWK